MGKKKTEETAMVRAEEFLPLAVLRDSMEDLIEAFRENVGGAAGPFDFRAIQIPAGGGTSWEVTTLRGDDVVKELDCVIVWAQDVRAYYRDGIDESGGGSPPDCASPDGRTGFGDPGGECAVCPFAAWGSAEGESRAQRCQQRKHTLILLNGGGVMPYFVSLPPTSLKAFRQYMFSLAGEGFKYWRVSTRLTLEKTKNAASIDFSRVVPMFGKPIDPELVTYVDQYREMITEVVVRKVETEAVDTTPPADDDGAAPVASEGGTVSTGEGEAPPGTTSPEGDDPFDGE
jgi:hypothetical protein